MSNRNMSFGSKHMWYSIGGAVVVALLAWVIISASTGVAPWALNTDQQATSTDTTKTGGGTTTGAGKYPAGWPADAPALQSGAKITYSGNGPKNRCCWPNTCVHRLWHSSDCCEVLHITVYGKGVDLSRPRQCARLGPARRDQRHAESHGDHS